jgi:hypothetical protein
MIQVHARIAHHIVTHVIAQMTVIAANMDTIRTRIRLQVTMNVSKLAHLICSLIKARDYVFHAIHLNLNANSILTIPAQTNHLRFSVVVAKKSSFLSHQSLIVLKLAQMDTLIIMVGA